MTIIYHHRTRCEGAEGVHIKGVKSAFKKRGFNVKDISLVQSGNEKAKMANESTNENSKNIIFTWLSESLPNIFFKILEIIYPLYALFLGKRALNKILKAGESVEFIYDRYAYFSFGMSYLAKNTGVLLVLEVNTTCLDYDVREIKFRNLAKKIEAYCFREAGCIVVVSQYLKDKISNEYNIDKQKIIVTPNAVDYSFLSTSEFEDKELLELQFDQRYMMFTKKRTIVGFVGIFVPWHGLEFLLDVFAKLVFDCGSQQNLGLILVGDGPMRLILEKKIKQLSLGSCVLLVGKVKHQFVKYYIDTFDIAIMPDSNPFGSPMKIFEYMARKKAIVVPSYEPILDVIEHQKNGMVFTKQDKDACVLVLKGLILNENKRIKLGENAYADVSKRHTWDNNVDNILKKING